MKKGLFSRPSGPVTGFQHQPQPQFMKGGSIDPFCPNLDRHSRTEGLIDSCAEPPVASDQMRGISNRLC